MTLLAKPSLLPNVPTLLNNFFDDERFLNTDVNSWSNKIPAANVVENDGDYSIELAAPGMAKKDFKVDIENRQLCISSKKSTEKKDENENFTRREFSYSSFSRSFLLPDSVDESRIKAKYEEGILYISLPKRPEIKQKKTAISVS